MNYHSIDNLIAVTGGRINDDRQLGHGFDRIAIDSRNVRPSDVFWAVRGERRDGHDFVHDALGNGAAACVVERNCCNLNSARFVEVDNTLNALWDYSRWWRRRQTAPVIGITGSFGKTTAREMIFSVLSQTGYGVRSRKNFNNHLGVPLSILDMQSHHTFAVLEIGASARGEVHQLAGIAEPQIGVVTGIGPAHLEGLGTVENIAATKAELIESLPSTGLAVLAGDDPHVRQMASRSLARVLFVGESEINDVRAIRVENGNECLSFELDSYQYRVPALGRHHLTAAIVAVALGREFGLSPNRIDEGLQEFRPARGRCNYRRIGSCHVIDDTYNSNPRSLEAACRMLSDWCGANQSILVTGDMLELGPSAELLHFEAGVAAARAEVDHVVAVGRHAPDFIRGAQQAGMRKTQTHACETIDEVTRTLQSELQPNDVVVVKGSRGMKMERVIDWLEQNELNLDSAICAGFAGIQQHRSAGEREHTTCLGSVITGSITPNTAQ